MSKLRTMENTKVIFPDVEVIRTDEYTEISTSVRVAKEDGSGYYFWDVKQRDYMVPFSIQETLCRFNEMVYSAMILNKVNEDFANQCGALFRMDESKETERERMKRIMLKKLGM